MSKRIRQIRITPVLNGFVVSVGCQEVVFESRGKLLEELHNYLNDPGEVEKAYIRQAVNPVSDSPLTVEECPTAPVTGESLGSMRYPTAGANLRT